MGFEIVKDQGVCRIVRVSQGGGGYLGYCERKKREKGGGDSLILTLVTSETEVDAWYRYLQMEGVALLEPPVFNPKFEIYHFFFRDPDGYKLEIQSFGDPEWKSSS